MSVANLISLEEYLRTSYKPDREYRDGVLVDRSVGNRKHSKLQALLARYIANREEQWNVEVYTDLRIRARESWYPIPDVALYLVPAPTDDVPDRPPFLWIEIVSPDDRITEVWEKAREAVACGTPYVWIIDPNTLESELWAASGTTGITDGVLRLPDSSIVIPLADVLAKK